MKTNKLKTNDGDRLRKQYSISYFLDEKFDKAIIGFQKEGAKGTAINRINLNLKK